MMISDEELTQNDIHRDHRMAQDNKNERCDSLIKTLSCKDVKENLVHGK